MDNRFYTLLLHQHPARQTAHTHYAVIHIRNDYGINSALDAPGIVDKPGDVYSLRGMHFRQYNKLIR
jgi:hypothetical protein